MGAVDTPERKSGKKKGGIARRTKRRVGIRIDMTPMVDVAFLLLIFFMVTTVFRTPKALEINLPPKDVKLEVKESMTLTLRMLADDRLYWKRGAASNPWNRSSAGEIKNVLQPFAGQSDIIVIVKIDRETEFERMVAALDELHAAKLTRFSINPLEDKEKLEVEGL